MKQKIRSLLLIFSAAAVLFSCGDAGVQVRVGDDFETNFQIVGAASQTSVSQTLNTTVNQELRDYGNFILDVEITQMTLTLTNFTGAVPPTNGQIVLTIAGETFDTGSGFSFQDNSSFTFNNATSLATVADRIQNGEVGVGLSISNTAGLGDNDFDIVITMSILATVGDENIQI
ncbi:MAG: hypothetical protein RIM99_11775 [Cyclobacteriaceae bacterium]